MKKENFIIAFSLVVLASGCTKDVSTGPKNISPATQQRLQHESKNPIIANPAGDGNPLQGKLPNQVTPLLDDPNAPGQYYCYYGDIRFVFSSFVHPIGAFAEGDPISACCGVGIDGPQGTVEGFNLGVFQNEVVAKLNTYCSPPNFFAETQAYNGAVSNYTGNRDAYIQQQMQQGVSYQTAFDTYMQNNPHPQLVNYVSSLYTDGGTGCTAQILRFKMIRITTGTTYGIVFLLGGGAS